MKARYREILDKSIAAMIASIEVYNKPDFSYREETFSILAINGWELMLKARILQIDNRISTILLYERRKKSDGTFTEKFYRTKNRSSNYKSLSLFKAYDRLVNDYGVKIDQVVRKNLEALTEIRDNSIHFLNKDFDLRKKVYEIGTANLRNYLNLVRRWFGVDLRKYNIFLMPIAFVRDIRSTRAITLNNQERNLLEYVKKLERESDSNEIRDYNLSLDINLTLKKVSSDSLSSVIISNAPDAIPITLDEESIRDKYPWDYAILTTRLQKRYSDFKQNQEYHQFRKTLEKLDKYCRTRYLDPGNPKSTKKNFYNPNIVKEFDKKYKKRSLTDFLANARYMTKRNR